MDDIDNCINEKDIKSYMKQFKVSRATAIKEIKQCWKIYYDKHDKEMEETYQSIIKSMY